jgi:hypothetical protein
VGDTPYRLLTTFETVATDTPATRATSEIVTRPGAGPGRRDWAAVLTVDSMRHRGWRTRPRRFHPPRVEIVIDNV